MNAYLNLSARRIPQQRQPIVGTEVSTGQLKRAFAAALTTRVIDPHVVPQDKQVEECLHCLLVFEPFPVPKKGFQQTVDRFNETAGTTGSVQDLTQRKREFG